MHGNHWNLRDSFLLLKASQRIIYENLYSKDILEKVSLYKDKLVKNTEHCARKSVI